MDIQQNQMISSSNTSYQYNLVKEIHSQEYKFDFKPVVMHSFKPLKSTLIYTMNSFTELKDIIPLIDSVRTTGTYSIYAERNVETKQVNSVTIELLQIGHASTTSLYFDLLNVPSRISSLFVAFQFISLLIFQREKRCFIWDDDQKQDLYALVAHKYLPLIALESIQIIQLQEPFKQWYNKTFQHNQDCPVPKNYIENSICCTCAHRPYKLISHKWGLVKALFYVFHETICTFDQISIQTPPHVQFSVECCMILTKLAMMIELDWSMEQLLEFKKYHASNLTINWS